jgi:type IV secretory pathway VirB10-like protein
LDENDREINLNGGNMVFTIALFKRIPTYKNLDKFITLSMARILKKIEANEEEENQIQQQPPEQDDEPEPEPEEEPTQIPTEPIATEPEEEPTQIPTEPIATEPTATEPEEADKKMEETKEDEGVKIPDLSNYITAPGEEDDEEDDEETDEPAEQDAEEFEQDGPVIRQEPKPDVPFRFSALAPIVQSKPKTIIQGKNGILFSQKI